MIEAFRDYFTEHTNPMRRIYHITRSPQTIINQNQFRLTFSKRDPFGTSLDAIKGEHDRVFYLSCMRTTTSGFKRYTRYTKDNVSYGSDLFLFELDAYKLLADGYRIVPFNFFKRAERDESESEDRIISDKPHIDNAKKYIDALHICLHMSLTEKRLAFSEGLDVYYQAKRAGIPVFLYDKLKYFNALRREKNVNEIIDKMYGNGENLISLTIGGEPHLYGAAEQKLIKSSKVLDILLNPTPENIDKLTTEDLKVFVDIGEVVYLKHTAVSDYLHELAKLMRKYKSHNLTELLVKILGRDFLVKMGIQSSYYQ